MRNLIGPVVAMVLMTTVLIPPSAGPAQAAGLRMPPYLAPSADPDESIVLPPPPLPDSATAAAERSVFEATRSLVDTARGKLATRDADRDPKVVLGDFACALGVALDPDHLPALVGLMARLDADVEQATKAIKNHYKRRRPLVGNAAPLCVARSAKLEESFSYPSGHATQGWTSALVLAELAPDRAAGILVRGRVFGESRIVCGAHWPSDVEAAHTAAASLVAVLHDSPEFRADLDRARQELAGARAGAAPAPDPAECRIEAEAAAQPLIAMPLAPPPDARVK